MSESDSEGIISKSQLAEFAELFDRFEFADDPRSQQACEAERMFNAKAEIAFREQVQPKFVSLSESDFNAGLKSWCRDWLNKNKPLHFKKRNR